MSETEVGNKWWGYLHVNGTIQAKRFFDQRDLQDAQESPFVDRVSRVILAKGREEALALIAKDLGI